MKPIPTIHAPTTPILAPPAREAAPGVDEAVSEFLAVVTRAIDAGTADLPPMSPIAAQAARLRKSAEPLEPLLLRIVESEPAVAGQVLRLASTAYFGQAGGAAASLRTACGQIGARTIVNLVETAARSDFLRLGKDGTSHILRKIWTNTLYTACAARELARWGGEVDPDEAFVAGMFHRVGEVLIVRYFSEQATADGGATQEGLLQAIVDDHQAAVGERLLRSWGLPESICAVAGGHADGTTLAAIVCAAWQSALHYGYAYLAARPDPAALREALKAIRLDPSDFEDIPETIGPALNAALSMSR